MSLKDKLLRAGLVSADHATTTEKRVSDERVEAERRRLAAAREQGAAQHVRSAPQYPRARALTLVRARELLAPHVARLAALEGTEGIEGLIDVETLLWPSVQWVDGDLALDELVMPSEGSSLFVWGDFTVAGVLHQAAGAGALVVSGTLRARHVVTSAEIVCVGGLEVVGVAYGNASDRGTHVLGRASVATLVSAKEHTFAFRGERRVGTVVDVHGGAPNVGLYGAVESASTRTVVPEAKDLCDEFAIAVALRAHDRIFESLSG